VAAGQPVVEIEMGRVTMEVESPAEGTIRIVVQRGTTVPVGATLAEILTDQEVAAAAEAVHPPPVAPEPPAPAPAPPPPEAPPSRPRETARTGRPGRSSAAPPRWISSGSPPSGSA